MSQTEWIDYGSSNCDAEVELVDTQDGRIHATCKGCKLEYFVRKT